jgi:hypothetical protein
MLGVEETTLDSYEGFVRNHIRPLIGSVPLGRINGEVLDSFYRTLARCRTHCKGKPFIQHRTVDAHDCDQRCKPHVCLWAPRTRSRHATCRYSWMRPPSRSRRSTRMAAPERGGVPPAGGR